MSSKASLAATLFFIVYSMAALRLKASTNAVYFRVCELPTLLTYISGAYEPTPNYGCYLTPFSIISAIYFNEGASCFIL